MATADDKNRYAMDSGGPADQPVDPVQASKGGAGESGYAIRDFQQIYGRLPTQVELAQITPAYRGADPHFPDQVGGKAFIAQMFSNNQNTPDKLYAKQQADYLAKAPEHFDSINSMFQSTLGRAATQDELNHFGSLLASGTTDQYQLQNFLQQQPEYQTKQNQGFQDKLSGQLAGYDSDYFKNNILPSLQEAYAKQGRSFDSSAFQAAATNSAQQQNVGRQQYLAQLSAQQYGGVSDRAYQDYANQVSNQQALTNSGINAQYQGIQGLQQRANDISDYNKQAQVYNDYLAKYGKRSNGLGGAIGGIIGGGIGAYLGGPQGAQAGFMMGNAGGNAFQNSQGGSY